MLNETFYVIFKHRVYYVSKLFRSRDISTMTDISNCVVVPIELTTEFESLEGVKVARFSLKRLLYWFISLIHMMR